MIYISDSLSLVINFYITSLNIAIWPWVLLVFLFKFLFKFRLIMLCPRFIILVWISNLKCIGVYVYCLSTFFCLSPLNLALLHIYTYAYAHTYGHAYIHAHAHAHVYTYNSVELITKIIYTAGPKKKWYTQ